MTKEQKLTQLTEKICELVPEIREVKFELQVIYHEEDVSEKKIFIRDIRLADVLLAIREEGDRLRQKEKMILDHYGLGGGWNLTKNALHLQDEETIDSLYSIICE